MRSRLDIVQEARRSSAGGRQQARFQAVRVMATCTAGAPCSQLLSELSKQAYALSTALTSARAHREGEDARCFLVECSERFLRRHALEGYDAHGQAGVLAIHADVEAGRADVPAADIVAAEIKQVGPVACDVTPGALLRRPAHPRAPRRHVRHSTPCSACWEARIAIGSLWHPPPPPPPPPPMMHALSGLPCRCGWRPAPCVYDGVSPGLVCEALVLCGQRELEENHEDAPAGEDIESGHVGVPAGPRWGASYATQLRILFTRCALRAWPAEMQLRTSALSNSGDCLKALTLNCLKALSRGRQSCECQQIEQPFTYATDLPKAACKVSRYPCAAAGRWSCGASSRCRCKTSASSSSSAC